jgi:hypothetical protein
MGKRKIRVNNPEFTPEIERDWVRVWYPYDENAFTDVVLSLLERNDCVVIGRGAQIKSLKRLFSVTIRLRLMDVLPDCPHELGVEVYFKELSEAVLFKLTYGGG